MVVKCGKTALATLLLLVAGVLCAAPRLAHAAVGPGGLCQAIFNEVAASVGSYKNAITETGFCNEAALLQECASEGGAGIHHAEYQNPEDGTKRMSAKRILVMGVFHGDEPYTAAVPLLWFKRMKRINPRNSWRFVPVVNPSGLRNKTRWTLGGADINRNFPTKDWGRIAKTIARRNPGKGPASEWETRCVLAHLDSFRPDVVVAIHAPYGLLDFDGPLSAKMPFIRMMRPRRLGTFPGSLGRYLWVERRIPVLTVELPEPGRMVPEQDLELLQDWAGTLAQQYRKAAP